MRYKEARQQQRRDDPRCDTLHQPINLPRPVLDTTKRDKGRGCRKAAHPMKHDTKERIGPHLLTSCLMRKTASSMHPAKPGTHAVMTAVY